MGVLFFYMALSKPNVRLFFQRIQENWKPGLTVALVALPLNIALSIASGAGPVPGIITGIWAGFIAAVFGGSNYNVVGTAGALTTLLAAFAYQQMGNGLSGIIFLPLIAIVSGLLILLVYAFRLEKYLIYIPSSVMYGFATGVAVLIALNQLPDALGITITSHSPHIYEKMVNLFSQFSTVNTTTTAVFLFAFILLTLLGKKLKSFPAIIPVTIVGVIIGWISSKGIVDGFHVPTLMERYPLNAALIQPMGLEQLRLAFSPSIIVTILNASLVISLVCVLETLITAKLADKITLTHHNSRKELFGLGLANIASGIAGGLPATGVFMRTGLNVKSGATHKTAAALTAIFGAIMALLLLPILQYLPMPVIAGMLFVTAVRLIEKHGFIRLWEEDKKNFFVGAIVAGITIFADASIGILLGIILCLLVFVDQLSRGEFEATFNKNHHLISYQRGSNFDPTKAPEADVIVYSIEGIFVYLDAPQHMMNMSHIINMPSVTTVIIRLRDLFYMDIDGRDMLSEVVKELELAKKTVLFSSPTAFVKEQLQRDEYLKKFVEEEKVFAKTADALAFLGFAKKDIGGREQLASAYSSVPTKS